MNDRPDDKDPLLWGDVGVLCTCAIVGVGRSEGAINVATEEEGVGEHVGYLEQDCWCESRQYWRQP